MNNPVYEIFLEQEKKTLYFCSEENFDKTNKTENDICVNMYIYGDDTLVDVINKIKLSIIKYIKKYNNYKFEELIGYLNTDWNYYNESFKIKEYMYLNIFIDKLKCSKIEFIEKLEYINKKYNKIDELDETIEMVNIKLDEIVDKDKPNSLVVGFFDRNKNFIYYISKIHMETLIEYNGIIENELNKPINNYNNYYIDKKDVCIKSEIHKYTFTLVDNDIFKRLNNISFPKYVKDVDTRVNLEHIYDIDFKNREKISKINEDIDNFKNKFITDINYLSLEITQPNLIDLIEAFNRELTDECPFNMIFKEKKRNYKLFKKPNKLPYIKQFELEKIIEEVQRGKKGKNYVLFKIYYKTLENIITKHFIDVYINDNNTFHIIFNIPIKINIETIIFNINNVLSILNLKIGDRNEITEDLLYYYNTNNTILINNNTNYLSSDIELTLNYSELDNRDIPHLIHHKFLMFVILFHTIFDIDMETIIVYYNKLIEIVKNLIVNEDKMYFVKKRNPIILSEINKLVFRNEDLKLFYKKSYYFESYNYIEKYFKYIASFEKHNTGIMNCNLNSGTKNRERYETFIKYGNFDKGFLNRSKEDHNIIDEIINKTNMENCKYIFDRVNEKTNLEINIDKSGIFYIKLINIGSFIELENICNLFKKFINYTDHYEDLFKMDLETRLEVPSYNNLFYNKGGSIYNMYNNIFNNHNTLVSKSNMNEYYLIVLLNILYNNTEIKSLGDNDFVGDFSEDESSDDSGEESEEELEDEIGQIKQKMDDKMKYNEYEIDDEIDDEIKIDENDIYIDEKEYKGSFNNTHTNRWIKFFKKYNDNCVKLCVNHSRPSMILKTSFDRILQKEENDKIFLKKENKNAKTFTELFDKEHNIKNITITGDNIEVRTYSQNDDKYFNNNKYSITKKNHKEEYDGILIMHIGREYIFNLKYINTTSKIKIMMEGDILKPNYDNIENEDSHFEIYSSNLKKKLTYDEYIDSNETEFYFKLNFQHNLIHKKHFEEGLIDDIECINIKPAIRHILCEEKNSIFKKKKRVNKQYTIGLYNILEEKDDTSHTQIGKDIQVFLSRPYNFYFDNYIFGDYYYIYLPSKTISADRGDEWHPYVYDDIVCCYAWDKTGPQDEGEDSLIKGSKKTVINKKLDLTVDKNFTLKPFKIGTIPESIYDKICNFLSLKRNSDYFKPKQTIERNQPYRFEILHDNKINKFLHNIFRIIKIDEKFKNKLPIEIKTYFKDFKIISHEIIKSGLKKVIQDQKIINNSKLRKLNNNIFYKNETLKKLSKKFKLISKKIKTDNLSEISTNNEYDKIRNGMIKYIDETFINMDVNFIWNICSIIFNINIIIFEISFTNELISNVKCPLVNNVNLYDFKTRPTCFIFNYEKIYQPITIPQEIEGKFTYKLLFYLNKDESILNLHNVFDKCLLRYNDNYYNNLLINSVYHNIDYSDNIILDTYELFRMKDYIKYIIINEDYIKLGVIFEIDSRFLFIPINYIKHNINYNIIEKNREIEYKYIYKIETDLDQGFIHNFKDTKILISKLVDKCKQENTNIEEKMNINKKYITNGRNVIGIGLKIGDYIPIIETDITQIELDADETLIEISEIGVISYYDTEDEIDTMEKMQIYNKFEYTNLYYEQFINSISHILYNIRNEIDDIIMNDSILDEKKEQLKRYLNQTIRDIFSFQDNMYLKDKKPTHNIINNFKLCHKLDVDENCNENCKLEDNDEKICKYIITEYYYNIFVGILINELLFNNYKKIILLNGIKNKLDSSLNENKYILLDDVDPKDKYIIYNLYNKIITEDHYYSIGTNYDVNMKNTNIKNTNIINDNYCTAEKYVEELDLTYYTFKSLTKMNIISYSNCIYYNLSRKYLPKHKNLNYIDNIRSFISTNIIEGIKQQNYDIYDIKNYYISQNDTHLYSNITNINNLREIQISDKHWITELDLYIFSLQIEKKILFYKKHFENNSHYMIMNEQFEDEIKIFVEPFYFRNLYYLVA